MDHGKPECEGRAAVCGGAFSISSMQYDDRLYAMHLQDKLQHNMQLLKNSIPADLVTSAEVFTSPAKHYRHKCRFAVRAHDDGGNPRLGYYIYDAGTPSVRVEQYPVGSILTNRMMPVLLDLLQRDAVLRAGIQAVTFLTTTFGDLSVTLIYDQDISGPEWLAAAERLRGDLQAQALPAAECAKNPEESIMQELSVVGRSKGVRILLGPEHVREEFRLSDGRTLTYQQHVDGFSNPNPYVNAKCLGWLGDILQSLDERCSLSSLNLLELYCGNGNHTVAISKYFNHAVLVELNPVLCACAEANIRMNGIKNVTVVPACHSQSFSLQTMRSGTYSSGGESFHFDVILVDPPRAGLDPDTIKLLKRYKFVIYISCSPSSLQRDLTEISKTHEVLRFAVFDQFAYTPHLECGVFLQSISDSDCK